MTTLEAPRVQPVIAGPTWQRHADASWVLPEHTLGWQILEWTAENLLQPDGPQAGEPWRFTPEQARFVLHWYAIDERGRFTWRRGVLRRMKGWGKDPLGAVLCAVEFVGPCRFDRWEGGQPVAVAHPAAWVQTAATALEQTKNTMTLFPALFTEAAKSVHDIDIGKEKIYAHGGRCRIEAVTSSARAMEGHRPTFVLENETHHWLDNNEGHAMSRVIARNLAKSRDGSARALQITNAHNPGEESVAETSWEAWQKIESGESRATGFLYDALEAPAETVLADRKSLRQGLVKARGDSRWLDVDRLIEEIYDPETPASTSRRFYLNQIVAAEDAWLTPQEWEACARRGYVVAAGAEIVIGFDGSRTDDHSALVGCEVATGHIFTLGIWDPAAYDAREVPRGDIDGAVAQAFTQYDVVGFYSDYSPFESYVDKWEEDHSANLCVAAEARHPIRYDFRTRQRQVTLDSEALHAAIVDRDVTHEGEPRSTQYVLNARRRLNNYGVTFGKEHRMSQRKVDWLAAAQLARRARQDYIALPDSKKRQQPTGAPVFYSRTRLLQMEQEQRAAAEADDAADEAPE